MPPYPGQSAAVLGLLKQPGVSHPHQLQHAGFALCSSAQGVAAHDGLGEEGLVMRKKVLGICALRELKLTSGCLFWDAYTNPLYFIQNSPLVHFVSSLLVSNLTQHMLLQPHPAHAVAKHYRHDSQKATLTHPPHTRQAFQAPSRRQHHANASQQNIMRWTRRSCCVASERKLPNVVATEHNKQVQLSEKFTLSSALRPSWHTRPRSLVLHRAQRSDLAGWPNQRLGCQSRATASAALKQVCTAMER